MQSVPDKPFMIALGTSHTNGDCEGGDLVFFQNKKIVLSAGEVVIFPSNFL